MKKTSQKKPSAQPGLAGTIGSVIPLFVPLKREFYERFEAGNKLCEYRRYGPGWNERTCFVGRPVVLSLGYGKQSRLYGTIIEAMKLEHVDRIPGWQTCYGQHPGPAMGFKVRLSAAGGRADHAPDESRQSETGHKTTPRPHHSQNDQAQTRP